MNISSLLALFGFGTLGLAAITVGVLLILSLRRDRLTHRSSNWSRRARRLRSRGKSWVDQRQLDLESAELKGLMI